MTVPELPFSVQSPWGFYNPVRIRFGRDCRGQFVDALAGQRLLVVTTPRGRRQIQADALLGGLLAAAQVEWVDGITENPGLADLQVSIDQLRGRRPYNLALAFGGGSAIDAAKVINTALALPADRLRLAELLAHPQWLVGVQPRPLYAFSTTAGTGSEVTPFATIWDHERRKKLSLAASAVFPHTACIDPALTDSLPLAATVSTGLDAINQAAESIWNRNATPITLAYATRALQLGLAALPRLASGQSDQQRARDGMAEAGLLAGLAISHTRTALCHSISYPITAHFGVPHGLACAFTMPAVLRHNLRADDGRFRQVAQAVTGSPDVQALVARFDELHAVMRVRERVREKVPSLQALLALEDGMFTPGRADNNLAGVCDLRGVLEQAWGG